MPGFGRSTMLAMLVVLAAACGGSDTSREPSTATSTTGTISPPITGPVSAGILEVRVDGNDYAFPAAACLSLDGDLFQVQLEARAWAQVTEDLAGRYASGWPTTTPVIPDETEARAAEIRAAGIQTLVLTEFGGIQPEILNRWENDLSEGRAANIQSRLAEWQDGYPAVAARVAEACFGLSY